ncbi:MAG: hypothetical protein AB4352_15960 [Hormoscilla sp.]
MPLQGVTVYGAIACIGHDLAWGDRMYGTNVSGRGTASAYRQINCFARKLGHAVPRWLMTDRMSETIPIAKYRRLGFVEKPNLRYYEITV